MLAAAVLGQGQPLRGVRALALPASPPPPTHQVRWHACYGSGEVEYAAEDCWESAHVQSALAPRLQPCTARSLQTGTWGLFKPTRRAGPSLNAMHNYTPCCCLLCFYVK
jgi:hypothetical protein